MKIKECSDIKKYLFYLYVILSYIIVPITTYSLITESFEKPVNMPEAACILMFTVFSPLLLPGFIVVGLIYLISVIL